MWKWIGGILLLIVVCFGAASWFGYRKLTAEGDVTSVTIAGSPDRVFAALANYDSLAGWWILKGTPSSARHGPLAVGDSLPAQVSPSTTRARASRWVADEVVPGKLLVLSLHTDTTGIVVAVQRDSLVSLGDSTQIITTIASPMMDGMRTRNGADSSRSGALIGMSSKLLISAMRLQSKVELMRLKSHIEGRPYAPIQP